MVNVIAHRGASRARRENTVEAFEYAVELGADGVELDVRLTADRALVIHHDARIEGGGSIATMTSQELPSHVPSLPEALDACSPLMVNVEIKNSARSRYYDRDMVTVSGVATVLAGRADGPFTISSFDLATVDAARDQLPMIPTAHLVDRGDSTRLLRRALAHGHRIIHPDDLLVDEVFMAQARQLGMEVNVWTVDDPTRMAELIDLGIDGIITNVPDIARVAVAGVGTATPDD